MRQLRKGVGVMISDGECRKVATKLRGIESCEMDGEELCDCAEVECALGLVSGKPFILERVVDITYTSKRRIEDMPEGWDGDGA